MRPGVQLSRTGPASPQRQDAAATQILALTLVPVRERGQREAHRAWPRGGRCGMAGGPPGPQSPAAHHRAPVRVREQGVRRARAGCADGQELLCVPAEHVVVRRSDTEGQSFDVLRVLGASVGCTASRGQPYLAPSGALVGSKCSIPPSPCVLQTVPEGEPVAAAQRSLFFEHDKRVPKGSLSDAEHRQAVDAEARRVQRAMQERYVSNMKRLEAFVATNGLSIKPGTKARQETLQFILTQAKGRPRVLRQAPSVGHAG